METMSSSFLNPWFTELEMEDPLVLQEFIGDCLVDYSPEDIGGLVGMGEEFRHHSHSPGSGSDCNSSTAPTEILGISNKRQNLDEEAAEKPWSLASSGSGPVLGLESSNKHCQGTAMTPAAKKPRRQAEQCHNHIIAERQRRQTLSQRFIALSALIPGLKKMDKTSVLGEAINHMKQLKEKLKTLEEENANRAVESVVLVKRSQVVVENESSISNSNLNSSSGSGYDETANIGIGTAYHKQLPEIEVRFSNKCVLVKIHCQMQKGVLVKLMSEIERLHLSVTSTNAMPFSATTVDITIMAQMEVEFNMSPQDVVKVLRSMFE